MSEIEDEVKAKNSLLMIRYMRTEHIADAMPELDKYFEGNYFHAGKLPGGNGAPWTLVVDLETMEILVTDRWDPWYMISNREIMRAIDQANND